MTRNRINKKARPLAVAPSTVTPGIRRQYGSDPLVVSPSLLNTEEFAALPSRECPVYLIPEEVGGFSVIAATLPGCASQGDTEKEALLNIIEAIEGCLEVYRDLKMPIPWQKPARRPVSARVYKVLIRA